MVAISGLNVLTDINSFVESFLNVERRPLTFLDTRKSNLQNTISVFSDLKTELSTLKTRVRGFLAVGEESKLGLRTVLSSSESIVTAKAAPNTDIGVNTIFISRIASRDTALSSEVSKNKTSLASRFFGTTQRFTIRVGSNASVEIAISFNDKDEENGDVLKRIANSINNAGIGVTANAIDVKKNSVRLAIVSKETGSTNAITLADDPVSSLLNRTGLPESGGSRPVATKSQGGFLIGDTEKLDALFTVNGVEITHESNNVTGIINGLTINLLKAQDEGDSPETITVSPDSIQLGNEIKGFIEDYNKVLKFINAKTKLNPVSNKRGVLAGNSNIRQLKFTLRELVSSNITGEQNPNISNITEFGIAINRDGTLKIDNEDEFEKRLLENANEVRAFFNSENGLAEKLDEELTKFTKFGGVIGDIQRNFQNSIRNIDRRADKLNERLQGRESNLRQRFTQLQRLLVSLTSQQRMLQQINFQFFGSQFGNAVPQFNIF